MHTQVGRLGVQGVFRGTNATMFLKRKKNGRVSSSPICASCSVAEMVINRGFHHVDRRQVTAPSADNSRRSDEWDATKLGVPPLYCITARASKLQDAMWALHRILARMARTRTFNAMYTYM